MESSAVVRKSFNGKENEGILYQPTAVLPLPLISSKLANQARQTFAAKPSVMGRENPTEQVLAGGKESCQAHSAQDFDDGSSVNTDPYASATIKESFDDRPDAAQVIRLKRDLEIAHERMAQMDLQLAHERDERLALTEIDIAQSHMARQTVEAAIGSPFPAPQTLPHSFNNFRGGRLSPLTVTHSFNQPVEQFSHPPSALGHYQPGYTPPMTPLPFQMPLVAQNNMVGYRVQDQIGTRSSQSGIEYRSGAAVWNAVQNPSSYMNLAEPLNYRRLLDREMSCNWKYIVDKIVCNNDQQASIFLQQKLKVGTAEQKFEIVQAIIEQAYPLMINRFGNFLVQRCFEHGTPEQIVAIAQAIRGNTLNLSMDAFGCHVIQKAFDSVPEEYKATMVHELLRRIPETVIHRYACHVWQKLFELRWTDTPPQIMKNVNEALHGMWHEVALGETGSLVVQNIFENCLEEDKRPCIVEVLASIDVVAHGQFGNWCIQHICEHGSIPDRTRAVDHIIRFATEYSMDQFASKVVEKCLKVGGMDFLDRYLDRVCEALPHRPRMPLIDIAGDQFGNYLVQHVLTNADAQRREVVAAHIRKHMVSLRGSKYGSRVAMLCCNPAHATRPGPPNNMGQSRSGNRFSDSVIGGDRGYIPEGQYAARVGRGGYSNYR